VVCFDESPTQLIGEVRQPIPATPGQLERYDCDYRRNGTVLGDNQGENPASIRMRKRRRGLVAGRA
jgi:hypothetical protein